MSVWSTISPTASHTFVLTDVIAAVVDTTPAAAATATEREETPPPRLGGVSVTSVAEDDVRPRLYQNHR